MYKRETQILCLCKTANVLTFVEILNLEILHKISGMNPGTQGRMEVSIEDPSAEKTHKLRSPELSQIDLLCFFSGRKSGLVGIFIFSFSPFLFQWLK